MPVYYNISGLTSSDSYIAQVYTLTFSYQFFVTGGVEQEQTSSGTTYRMAFDGLAGHVSRSTSSDFGVNYLRFHFVIYDQNTAYIIGSDPTGELYWYSITYLGNVSTGKGGSLNLNSSYFTITGNPNSSLSVTMKYFDTSSRTWNSVSTTVTLSGENLFGYYYNAVSAYQVAIAIGGMNGGYAYGDSYNGYGGYQIFDGEKCVAGIGRSGVWLAVPGLNKLYYITPQGANEYTINFSVQWPDGVTLTGDDLVYAGISPVSSYTYVIFVYRTPEGLYRIAFRDVNGVKSGLPPIPAVYNTQADFYIYGYTVNIGWNKAYGSGPFYIGLSLQTS